MSNVWSFYTGARPSISTAAAPRTEWTYLFPFSNLNNLLDQMNDAHLRGRIDKLAIQTHGNLNGELQLEGALSETYLRLYSTYFLPLFNRLRWFLKRDAYLIFSSCGYPSGANGVGGAFEDLIIAISRILPGRTIVSFEKEVHNNSLWTQPGWTWIEVPQEFQHFIEEPEFRRIYGLSDDYRGTTVWATPTSIFAKWAKDGIIIRRPISERVNTPHFRCGRPSCQGHLRVYQYCSQV